MDITLSPYEARVIGCLIEKEKTTPDQYPLSLNAWHHVAIVFDTQGRRPVADLFVEAFEVAQAGTTGTESFILFQSPEAGQAAYPVFEGSDTLRTPAFLGSLPVDQGGDFLVGVRRDFRFLADSTAEGRIGRWR